MSLLGLQVKQLENGIFISQSKYAKHLVKKFRLDLAKHIRTPISTNLRLTKDDSGSDVDPCLYRSMIGSVLYLTGCRVNIYFSVGDCARCQANPEESHLSTAKHIIHFVNGTINDGIWYVKDTNSSIVRHSDAN